jgi:hypothetical protein
LKTFCIVQRTASYYTIWQCNKLEQQWMLWCFLPNRYVLCKMVDEQRYGTLYIVLHIVTINDHFSFYINIRFLLIMRYIVYFTLPWKRDWKKVSKSIQYFTHFPFIISLTQSRYLLGYCTDDLRTAVGYCDRSGDSA